MANSTGDWYDDAFDGVLHEMNYIEVLMELLGDIQKKVPTFAEAQSYLSIGSARGDLDSRILALLPNCRSYTGLEPSEYSIPHLNARIKQDFPLLKADVINSTMDSWSGPPEPVEMIVAAQVMYYFDDPKDSLRKLLSWLSPGGLLLIVLGDHDSVFTKVALKWGFASTGTGTDYRQPNLMRDLKELGTKAILEEQVTIQIDHTLKSEQRANFLLHRKSTETERKDLFTFLDEVVPTGVEKAPTWVTIVQKH